MLILDFETEKDAEEKIKKIGQSFCFRSLKVRVCSEEEIVDDVVCSFHSCYKKFRYLFHLANQ